MNLTLGLVIGTALIDAINPCAIGVLVVLISVLMKQKEKNHMLKITLLYTSVVFLVYMISGLGLVWLQSQLVTLGFGKLLAGIIGVALLFGAVLEIKDFFAYGKGWSLSIPTKYAKEIKRRLHHLTIWGTVALGGFVAMVELPCTGGPYLAITSVLAEQFDLVAFLYLILYNFIFVLPLLIIAFITYFGIPIVDIEEWKKKNRKWMRLFMGLLLLGFGVYMLLRAFGVLY